MNIDQMERLFSEHGKEELFNSVRLVLVTETDWQELREDVVKEILQHTFQNGDEFLKEMKQESRLEDFLKDEE